MNRLSNNTTCRSLALGAVLVFAYLTLGGAIAHEHIHHHTSHEEQSSCSVVVLMMQFLLAVTPVIVMAMVMTAVAFRFSQSSDYLIQPLFSSLCRAPPAFCS